MSNFEKNIKKLRTDLNLKQSEFASKLGLDKTTISTWENGRREPSLDTLIKISQTFDVSYEDLLL